MEFNMPKSILEIVTLIIVILFVAYLKRDEIKNAFYKKPEEEMEVKVEEDSKYRAMLATSSSSNPKTEEDFKKKYHSIIDDIIYGGDKDKFHEIIEASSIPKKGDKDYITGLGSGRSAKYISYFYRVFREFEKVTPHFIFELDWKAGVDDLKWHIESALKNTPYKPKLPNTNKYPSDASILHGLNFSDPSAGTSLVFTDYLIALDEVDLELIFVESYSDQYILFLAPLDKTVLGGTGLFFSFRIS